MDGQQIIADAKKLSGEIISVRRQLHKNAEVGFNLHKTCEIVKAKLREYGVGFADCGRAGVVALIGDRDKGKTFMLRADMDALPIAEETGLPYACADGAMHACGHDMHAAMLLGAAVLLKDREQELCGCVKLMFQPAEEIFEGSQDMIEDGLLQNPETDAALMIHVMAGMPLPCGTVMVSGAGVSAPAADYFTVEVEGKGCHGSMPNVGIDPVTAAAHIVIALQEIAARELGIGESATLTIGSINGGNAANAIPDKVTLCGTLRTFDEDVRSFVKGRLSEICVGIAKSFRATARVTFGSSCPSLLNDGKLCESALKYSRELLGKGALSVEELTKGVGGTRTAGSEDFAYISRRVPSVMLALAAGEPCKGFKYPQHHPKVTFDESALYVGSAVYAYLSARWLEEN